MALPVKTIYIKGLQNSTLSEIIGIMVQQIPDCVNFAILYEKNGTAFLSINTHRNCDILLKYFDENEIFYNHDRCLFSRSTKEIRLSGLNNLKIKPNVSIWIRKDLRDIFARIAGLLAIAPQEYIMGCSLAKIYKKQYGEDFIYNFCSDTKLIDFLQKGVNMNYFELSHRPPNDFRIYMRGNDKFLRPTFPNHSRSRPPQKELAFSNRHFYPRNEHSFRQDSKRYENDTYIPIRQGNRMNHNNSPKRDFMSLNSDLQSKVPNFRPSYPSNQYDYRPSKRTNYNSTPPWRR